MNLETYKEMINSLIQYFKKSFQHESQVSFIYHPSERAKFLNVIHLAYKFLPEHETFFNRVTEGSSANDYDIMDDGVPALEYVLELVSLEEKSTSTSRKKSVFDSVDDKVSQATLAFKKEDYPAVLNHLNTALELMLKDKLEIPTTITKINTSKIIDIMIAEKIGPYLHITETKKHLCQIDNKIKHQVYSPNKVDCINALKVLEDLENMLKKEELKLNYAIKQKIYSGIELE